MTPSVLSAGVSETAGTGDRVCESCAREDDELVAVRRMYVTPESWDTTRSEQTMPDVELWCFSCRSMYPHELADD